MMTAIEATRSLKSTDCPGCGGFKRSRRSVCSSCWSQLPKRMQSPLYDLVGRGYEKALAEAIAFLESRADDE